MTGPIGLGAFAEPWGRQEAQTEPIASPLLDSSVVKARIPGQTSEKPPNIPRNPNTGTRAQGGSLPAKELTLKLRACLSATQKPQVAPVGWDKRNTRPQERPSWLEPGLQPRSTPSLNLFPGAVPLGLHPTSHHQGKVEK